ncbi:MAG TPA: rRNA maturation RNase YbeY [Candidatus Avoscillospira stercorigallinarum]|mgnify:CR=1 FL=1|uniref:Endoribonuclease YbeY n=1 Tax=Candidatus Avoscillospira stercorigallinarum TaxID=2840708 RepID=A0A9D0Z4Y8_9FIRM|nr:rRNA maturation RNase YbeY [Candidatus Avoscillospira stercorigallinarum]
MKYKINLRFDVKRLANVGMSIHIRRCIAAALKEEGVNFPCEINVLVTGNDGIQAINDAQRHVNQPTDVLSFPMFSLTPGQLPEDVEAMVDPDTGLVPLGDMVISLDRAMSQAEEFGHGIKRELGYLVVHSVLHLLGYDHLDEGPMKQQMRRREEEIMARLLLKR